MSIRFASQNDDEEVVLRIRLDPETARFLRAIADEARCSEETIAAAILHDVLLDDDLAHKCDLTAPANENNYH